MSDEYPDDIKGFRRSRKSEEGRDFICGCGKNYLSYPALYTHIKTKHNGNQPDGTQKNMPPHSSSNNYLAVNPPNRSKPKTIQNSQLLASTESLVSIQHLKITNLLAAGALGSQPPNNRVRKHIIGRQLWMEYGEYCKLQDKQISLTKDSNLSKVLIAFLIGAGKHASESLMKNYNIFARMFYTCYMNHGVDVFQACFKEQSSVKQIEVNQCKMAPIICDFFIRFYVPKEIKDKREINVYELITHDFCEWMRIHALTVVQVTMGNKYELRKPASHKKATHHQTIKKTKSKPQGAKPEGQPNKKKKKKSQPKTESKGAPKSHKKEASKQYKSLPQQAKQKNELEEITIKALSQNEAIQNITQKQEQPKQHTEQKPPADKQQPEHQIQSVAVDIMRYQAEQNDQVQHDKQDIQQGNMDNMDNMDNV